MRIKNTLALALGAAAAATSASALLSDNDVALLVEESSLSSIVIYSTRVHTITSCAAWVTDCPIVTSVIDETTTFCPVTAALSETAALSQTATPIQTISIGRTETSTLSDATAGSTKAPESTLISPETSTSFVYSTITIAASTITVAANGSSSASGPPSPANSTIMLSTAAGGTSFSSNMVDPVTASHGFNTSAIGPLATGTGAMPIESIVPYTGGAVASAMAAPFLATAVLIACGILV